MDLASSEARDAQNRIGHAILDVLSQEDWDRVTIFFCQPGTYTLMSGETEFQGNRRFPSLRSHELRDALVAVRDLTARPERGAWISAHIEMSRTGDLRMSFNWDRRVWDGDDPFEPPIGDPYPTDDDWIRDLQQHPRSPEFTPRWMAELGTKQVVAETGNAAATGAFSARWPAGLEGLADAWGWPAVWEAISTGLTDRLSDPSVATAKTSSDPDERERHVEGIGQEIVAEVWAELFASRTMEVVVEMWNELQTVRPIPPRAPLDDITPDKPLTPRPSGADAVLVDQVVDVIDELVDAQVRQQVSRE